MKKIAVIFPGIGYTTDKPILYYSRKIAMECDYEEVIPVVYTYKGGNIRGDRQKIQEAFEALYVQAKKVLDQVRWEQYGEILFISKSIGTVVAARYAEETGLRVRHVLYTPLEAAFLYHPAAALAFIGTKDPWSRPEEIIRQCLASGITVRGIEDGNHSLETGSPLADIATLGMVMKETRQFLLSEKPQPQ